ncbi:MAG TPA: RNA polymerase sigma factor [Gemmataceae bacterium]|nr:RNA polymerase sigma factor [Gemmataceae bacterium]
MFADDASLVLRCLRNDADAVRALVEQFQGIVYGLCVRLLGDRHDAEDVTQEVFIRVFRSLRRWDSTRPLQPWVLGIAANRCRTWMTRAARRPVAVGYLEDTAADPRADLPADDAPELARELTRALAALRPDYRTAFVLFHERGQPYEAIAAVLGRPVGTVKTWLHRARLELLDALRRRGMVDPQTTGELRMNKVE